jgi:MFS family permease
LVALKPEQSSHFTLATPRSSNVALLLACIAVAIGASLWRGQDANWDLQNYHYYNPWAWWNGRIFDRDIAAAQLQTFHNPLPDLPFFWMVAAGWPPRLIAAVLAIPAGIAAFLFAKLLALLFSDLEPGERRVAIACAFAIGVTSAMGIAVLGTTMNEWPLVALTLAGMWLIVRALAGTRAAPMPWMTLAGAGLLCGLASGAKLTAATFAVGLCLALLLRGPWHRAALWRAFREAFVFGLGVLAGMAVTMGPWAWQLWTHFESPVFPYGNVWIKSPWWIEYPVLVRRYGPQNLGEWLLFPFHLIGPGTNFVTEVSYRDARFPLTWALAIVAGAAWLSLRMFGRVPPPAHPGVSAAWRLTSVFFITSFLLWTAQHSIYRYIVTLDLLTGALIITLLQRLIRPGFAPAVMIVVAIALISTTRVADWWHIKFGETWFEVQVPAVENNALVLISTDAPVGFVLPFFPADARHLGVNNSINDPSRINRLAQSVAETIRNHGGPLYQLTVAAGDGTAAVEALGLVRQPNGCSDIHSRMPNLSLQLCRLQRLPAQAPH